MKKLAKAKKAAKEALAKAQETKPETKEAVEASAATEDLMKAGFQVDLEKTMQAEETAQGAMTTATTLMFAFYSNLLSPESKYMWNKIIVEQTEGDPYVNLQGVSLEGPRGMSCELFNDCMMFCLLTAFPINAAEQENYYISNVLKKPQRINMRHFVRRVEQLNAYIAQMPCFIYSPNANTSTKPENVPFNKAELGAHMLCMCPIQWQDQYNMNKKGMTPMDMRLLLISLERLNTYVPTRRANQNLPRSLLSRARKGRSALVPRLQSECQRRFALRSIATCARSMGARIPRTTHVSEVGLRKMERRSPISAPLRKTVRKTIP